jgi:hypothetical protein
MAVGFSGETPALGIGGSGILPSGLRAPLPRGIHATVGASPPPTLEEPSFPRVLASGGDAVVLSLSELEELQSRG